MICLTWIDVESYENPNVLSFEILLWSEGDVSFVGNSIKDSQVFRYDIQGKNS